MVAPIRSLCQMAATSARSRWAIRVHIPVGVRPRVPSKSSVMVSD